MRHRNIPLQDWDLYAVAAARLRSEKGKDGSQIPKQQDIAEYLRISQPDVARLLDHARDRQWLVETPRFDETKTPHDLQASAEARFFSFQRLKAAVAKAAEKKGIRTEVAICIGDVHQFYELTADYVARLLEHARLIGVTWGRTLAETTRVIAARASKTQPVNLEGRVIPLSGDPVFLGQHDKDQSFSSTTLAAALYRAMLGDPQHDLGALPVLNAVPAYIASRFKGSRGSAIREFIDSIPGYAEIFGTRGTRGMRTHGLVDDLDMILTGAGLVTDDPGTTGTFVRERQAQEPQIKYADLKAWVYGEVGGILLPRPRLPAAASRVVRALNDGWVGIQLEHLKSCAKRATERNLPGPVVISHQSERAELLSAIVREGMASTLIIHSRVAVAMEPFFGLSTERSADS